MKKLVLSLMFILSGCFATAQITFEHEYNHSGAYVELAQSGTKFYIMDVAASQCRIYNTDHSIWKTISLDVPGNHYLYDIRYVSENLFSTDNVLALLYIFYHYDEEGQFYTYFAKVINENGTVLLDIPGTQYAYVNDLGDEGVKLTAYVYDYSVYPSTVKTRIYDLPGEPVSAAGPVNPLQQMAEAFPNPANSFTRIPYRLLDGYHEGTVILTDVHGNRIREYRVDRTFKSLYVNTSELPDGIYFYQLKTGNHISYAGKLVVRD